MTDFTPGAIPARFSKCNKCGARWPSAPPGVIHKCQCSGGMCYPEDPTTSLPEPAEELAPAEPRALERSIAELEAFEREGKTLYEVENEVSFLESVALCLHELKRLRALDGNEFVPAYSAVETAKHYAELPHVSAEDIERIAAIVKGEAK